MKVAAPLLLLAAFSLPCASTARVAVTPVSRVVELLQNLAHKVDEELTSEESLYETYVCWGKAVVDTKTASNAKAESRVKTLESYVADLDAGRIELTTERADLEKELKELNADIQTAEALRSKENEDYTAAKDEMDQAISALDEAIGVMAEGAGEPRPSQGLISVQARLRKAGLNNGARLAEVEALGRAVELGNRFLSKGDARFLERVLNGEVPTKEWKKLNRKADFKMKYKARSTEIQGVLQKLKFTFTQSRQAAETKETEAAALHEKLMTSKREQLSKAEEARAKMEKEGGARGLSKVESQAEIEALKTQITNDEQFIAQTEKDLETKKEEWATRKSLRLGEIKALNEAVAVLHDDNARDTFKRSMTLLQQADGRSVEALGAVQRRDAASAINAALRASSDGRLAGIVARVTLGAGGNFDKVVASIDSMIATLNTEEQTDLTHKENCEKDRAEDTRSALTTSRDIDEKSDEIARLKEEIKEIEGEIEDKHGEITKIQAEVEEATVNRAQETAEWHNADADDAEAITILHSAKAVLTKFYAENGLSLAQARKHSNGGKQQPGEAPPPPPATWEAPYSGKKGESTGVITIITLIAEDMAKDKAAAKAAEEQAQAAFVAFKSNAETQVADLNDSITEMTGTKGEKEGSIADTETDRATQKGLLKAVMDKLKAAAPGCDYFTVNFATRSSNRQIEIDGLNKAKAILQGAKFE